MGIKKSLESLVGTFQRFLLYSANENICIYNILVRVYFSWIVFPILSNVKMLDIGAYDIPSKHLLPRIDVVNMFILLCCIAKFYIVFKSGCKIT